MDGCDTDNFHGLAAVATLKPTESGAPIKLDKVLPKSGKTLNQWSSLIQ